MTIEQEYQYRKARKTTKLISALIKHLISLKKDKRKAKQAREDISWFFDVGETEEEILTNHICGEIDQFLDPKDKFYRKRTGEIKKLKEYLDGADFTKGAVFRNGKWIEVDEHN